MANIIICDIVTPEAKVFNGEAVLVSAPAAEGDIGLMYQCAPLMSTLRQGVVRIKDEAEKVISFAVSGGYLEVDGYKVVILASRALDLAKVDKDIANERIAQNEKRVSELKDDDPAKAYAEAEVSWQQYLLSQI